MAESRTLSPNEASSAAETPGSAFFRTQIIVALALAGLFSSGFVWLDYRSLSLSQAGAPIWNPVLPVDALIPFFPSWVWLYIAYYPACFSPLALRQARNDRGVFWQMVAAYLFQFSACFLVFWFLPSGMVRPLAAGGPWTKALLVFVYRADPGYNIFPSLHVSLLVYTASLVGRYVRALAGALFWVLAVLIILSTVFVKQHCIIDLIAGAGLGLAAYLLFHTNGKILKVLHSQI
jgi:membrane-associated phospholipid phosphatase